MKPYTLCYFSATATEIPSLSEGVRLYTTENGALNVYARTQTQLFDRARQEAFVREAMKADVLIIALHGGRASFPASDLLEAVLAKSEEKRPLIHVQPTSGDEDSIEAARKLSTDFGSPGWDMVKQYLSFGGHLNFHQLMIFLHNRLQDGLTPCPQVGNLTIDGLWPCASR